MPILVREPGASFFKCALTFLDRQPIDLKLALEQHRGFVAQLRSLGREVLVLPAIDHLADACFVEDPAVVLDDVAVITRPLLEERRRECAAVQEELSKHRPLLRIEAPATLEGGDVLEIDRVLYVGWSKRTNHAGLKSLAHLLLEHDYRIKAVELSGCLHLKTAVTQVAGDLLLANRNWADLHRVQEMRILEVHPDEPFAACGLWTGGTLIYPEGFPRTRERLEQAGVRVISLPFSEFQKAEGGPTGLALDVR